MHTLASSVDYVVHSMESAAFHAHQVRRGRAAYHQQKDTRMDGQTGW
jgi:hypothetical protein